MGCLYSKMSRDSDDHYEKITNDDIDLATAVDVESENDVVCGPEEKSDILDLTSSKDLEDGQNPSLDRERQDDAAQKMQVLKDITRAQLEELRRARDRLFRAYIYQEARLVAKAFKEAASDEVAEQQPLTDDATWLTPGGEGWEEEMISFLTTEVDVLLKENEEVVEVEGGKEEEEEKEKKGEIGDGEVIPSSVRHEALLVADMFRQSPNIDMINRNEDEEGEEEGEEEKDGEKEKKEETGDGEEVQASFLLEALRVADMIRQSPNINPNQDSENIDENASSCGCYDDEILDDEQTTSSCMDEEDGANIFLDNVMEAVSFMVQESALLNERAFLNKKIAYMQMLVLKREQAKFIQTRAPKEASKETPPSPAGDELLPSPYQTQEIKKGGDETSSSYHGDPWCDAEEGVAASSTEDCDDVLVEMKDVMEDDIDNDDGHEHSGSVRVFLDWLMGEVEARIDLDQRFVAIGGRVPSQSHDGIPAFPGTSGMTWDEALRHIHREDTRRGKEEEGKRDSEGEQGPGLRRVAARNSWLFKLILQLDAEDEEREQLAESNKNLYSSRIAGGLDRRPPQAPWREPSLSTRGVSLHNEEDRANHSWVMKRSATWRDSIFDICTKDVSACPRCSERKARQLKMMHQRRYLQ